MGPVTGTATGFSARIVRATITTEAGDIPIVIKQDSADVIGREVTFYRRFGAPIGDWIPTVRGSGVDDGQGVGVLVLDDLAPAVPLDVLAGCDHDQAVALVTTLARLHTAHLTGGDDDSSGLPRWRRRPMDPDRWTDRVAVAHERFPLIVGPEVVTRLASLRDDVAAAVRLLDHDPPTVIHGDIHLDNVMWRPDGRIVLLDWAGAAVGPAAVDIAGALLGGLADGPDDRRSSDLVATYADARRGAGAPVDPAGLTAMLDAAIVVMTQGLVGWAGSPGLGSGTRRWAVCAKQLETACAWLRL